ncbi:MAG: FKBP-type peptidyl-prolyl cis-trans isomerase [Bacteroidales bacterium]|nr:FKBP-type peptidyl-prolyl cis-trans isomerase [Bacteroidales bacterium]
MEDLNEEKINQEETPQEEVAQEAIAQEETATETIAEVANDVAESEASCECENGDVEEDGKKCKCNKKKLWIIIGAVLGVLAIAAIILACMGKFSKYPGFKKDRSTGIYYQFYGDIHDTAAMPQRGDLVGVLFSLRTADSVLIPMIPNQMVVDSVYEGDFFAALQMMHVGDSATFIFDGPTFFEKMFQGQEYPFGDEPLYMDVKLFGRMAKADFEKAQAEYMNEMKQKEAEEATLIQDYVKKNNITVKPTEEGVYIISKKAGTGPKLQMMQTVKVHYTGKLLDGTQFDSSIGQEPFEVTLGGGQVIPGWEVALSHMSVGEKATIIIPSAMAYGARGMQSIPPYSTLVFDMEVVGLSEQK